MLHGAGGQVMHDLVKNYIVKHFGEDKESEVSLQHLDDAAVVDDIVLKSDSHVVKPIFFPGGDIGRLAISGTVNDLAAVGAIPRALTCGLILEEGLSFQDFEKILISMEIACAEAGVHIVTGDTKVIEKGTLGGCVINTSGIGKRSPFLDRNFDIVRKYRRDFNARWILDSNGQVNDQIILSGTIGDHGLAVLSKQEGISFGSEIQSDVKPLNRLIQGLLKEVGGIVAMKDPTRGGLADTLNEFSEKSHAGILVHEKQIPIREDVKTACEMLGLDPLEIGNEGKIVIIAVKEKAAETLDYLRSTKEGEEASIIGEVTGDFSIVAMQTLVGGKRIISRPIGDPIPRIC